MDTSSINWIKPGGVTIRTNGRQATTEKATELGWKRVDLTVNADKGSGQFGSNEWHKSAILGMSEKSEVHEYLTELKLSIDKRGNLKKVKAKAIDAISKR